VKVNTGAVLSAVLTFAAFVVLPLALPSLLPPELMAAITQVEFDFSGLLNEMAIIGVALSVLALAKGFVNRTSPLYPALSAFSNVIWLVFSLLVIGLGQIGTLGVTELSFEVGGGVNTIVFDMSMFAYIAVITVGLKIVHSILEFLDARSTTKAQRKEQVE